MRKLLNFVAVLFVYTYSLNCSAISVADLKVALASNEAITVIDVRNRIRFQKGHIPSAINIPQSMIAHKRLPAIGRVVVYDDGIDESKIEEAVNLLNTKSGVHAESLKGGFSTWKQNQQTTFKRGLTGVSTKEITLETFEKYISNDIKPVVIDLRSNESVTNLLENYPKLLLIKAKLIQSINKKNHAQTQFKLPQDGRINKRSLFILIDNGNGESSKFAYRLQAMGYPRVAILAGGEHAFTSASVKVTTGGE